MKVSGFSIIRNAVKMGYPITEAIESILPLVDEFVLGIGQSDDETKSYITERIRSPKLQIFDAHWDTTKTTGGLILSEKTNEALERCSNDWCFYIQADECVHENDLNCIYDKLKDYENSPQVEGLLFKYVHFYGSYDVIATSRKWYRNEVRVIKKSSGARSVGDAQSFRVFRPSHLGPVPSFPSHQPVPAFGSGQKASVKESGAAIYHYGWVKTPRQMGEKSKLLDRWWHGSQRDHKYDDFQFSNAYGLRRFEGTHPSVIQKRVNAQDWVFRPRRTLADWTFKDLNLAASDLFEKVFGHRVGEYKNYRLIKTKGCLNSSLHRRQK